MRVLLFSYVYPNDAEPAKGTFVHGQARALRDAGADVRVVSPVPYFPALPGFGPWSRIARAGRRGQIDGITVEYPRTVMTPIVGRRFDSRWMALGAGPAFARVAADWAPDVIVAHYLYPAGHAALSLADSLGCPLAVFAHGRDGHTLPRRSALRRKIAHVVARADRIFAVSDALRRSLIQRVPAAQGRVDVFPFGVDTARFRPRDRVRARSRLGLPVDGPLLLGVGRLTRNKRWDLAIEAVARLHRQGRPVALRIVGPGRRWRLLQPRIDRLGLHEAVRIVGPRPHDELPDWYAAADALVHPSEREGRPSVLMEALACGTPIVARAMPANAEVAPSPRTSILVEAPTPATLAAAIGAALDGRWDRDALVAHGVCGAWAKLAPALLNQLRTIVAT